MFFQVIHPEALTGRQRTMERVQNNIQLIVEDILGHGNSDCLLPGQLEYQSKSNCDRAGGLIFSSADIHELNKLAQQLGLGSVGVKPYIYD